ncbi:MAG TPA: ribbon-helix-helix protein, CopG family [Candidatus Dormibacteraeota bacterium]|nr:ribbon-helix-helix protein, CopG family [Candidatus Dormibacteraeota bacterium]
MATGKARRRAKVSITIDPALLDAVDVYVQRREGMDRSKVMETALQDWYRARQEEAMVDQFSASDSVDKAEQRDWRRVRRTAATRKLRRPGT